MNPRALAICVLLGGMCCCTTRKDAASLDEPAPVPERYAHTRRSSTSPPLEAAWWRGFGSGELNGLIGQARSGSHDIAAALARVEQAWAQRRIASAALWPELSADGGITREGRLKNGTTRGGNAYAGGLAVSYEADLWGRLRAGQRSAGHQFAASVFDHDATVLLVTSETAAAWLQSVAWRDRLRLAENNLDIARKTLAFIDSRVRAGAALPQEGAQQRGLVAAQEDTLASSRIRASESDLALGLLLGQAGAAPVRAASLDNVKLPSWTAGIPSELLTRRPDLARAEAALAAAEADIHAARAALLPRLTFSAGLNVASPSTTNLFEQPLYSLASGLAAPIFQGGRLRAEVALSQARREELLANYRQAIITAFGEVEAALLLIRETETRRAPQETQLAQARRAHEISESRYRAGAETLLSLLTTQQTLFAAEESWLQWRHAQFQAILALYKSLGGGWGK